MLPATPARDLQFSVVRACVCAVPHSVARHGQDDYKDAPTEACIHVLAAPADANLRKPERAVTRNVLAGPNLTHCINVPSVNIMNTNV